MPLAPRHPLRLASQADDRIVLLGCETCDATVPLRTADGLFAAAVHAFFALHARCVASVQLG